MRTHVLSLLLLAGLTSCMQNSPSLTVETAEKLIRRHKNYPKDLGHTINLADRTQRSRIQQTNLVEKGYVELLENTVSNTGNPLMRINGSREDLFMPLAENENRPYAVKVKIGRQDLDPLREKDIHLDGKLATVHYSVSTVDTTPFTVLQNNMPKQRSYTLFLQWNDNDWQVVSNPGPEFDMLSK